MTKPKENISRDQISELPIPTFSGDHFARKKPNKKTHVKTSPSLTRLVYELAMIQCTLAEIADIIQCDPTTVSRRFNDIIEHGKSHGRMSVRRMQYRKAMEGSVPMLMWLGKHWLGQRETENSLTSYSEAKELFSKWQSAPKLAMKQSPAAINGKPLEEKAA